MGSPLPPDPYAALGIAKDATSAAIKTAYRKLALKSHPDKFPDPAQKAEKAAEFHKIQQAYEILGDDDKRERYNAQVRLAELRKEALERQQARGSTSKPDSRPAAANYDIRTPSNTAAYATRGSSRPYEEPRSRSVFDDDDHYDEPRSRPRSTKHQYVYSNKRTASPPPRRPSTFKIFLNPHERARTRDQEKKRERVEKFAPVYNDSDSDERFRYEERKRKDRVEAERRAREEDEEQLRNAERFRRQAEEDRRRVEEVENQRAREREATRRSSSRRPEPEYLSKEEDAREYMKRRSTRGASVPPEEIRPSATRSSSKYAQVRSKDPSKSSKRSTEKSKESRILAAGIRHGRGSREKERKSTRAADSEYEEDMRRPALEKSDSSPAAMRAAVRGGAPERSQTMDSYEGRREREEPLPPHPKMRRAETMPAQASKSSQREKVQPNSSKLRTEATRHAVHDSGYSSPSTSSLSDRENQQPGLPRMTTTQYRYSPHSGGVPVGNDDPHDIYHTVTVEPPSSSERLNHKPTSRSPARERIHARDVERDSDDSGRGRMSSGRTRSNANTTRYNYPAEAEWRPHVSRTQSSQVPISHSPQHDRGYDRERIVSPERTHTYDDRGYDRSSSSRLYNEVPISKQAGEPLRRPPPRRGDTYTKSDVRYRPKITPEDILYSRSRGTKAEEAYAFSNVQLPRPPIQRGYTTVM